MTTTHTFRDGITRPAHRHRNPDGTEGGWVAGSATVPASCYVASTAEIGNGCTLGNYCKLGNYCTLGNGCTLGYGCTWEESPPQMQIGRWLGVLHSPGTVAIGCQVRTIDEWERDENRLIEEFGATDYEQALARVFIALCRDVDAARRVR